MTPAHADATWRVSSRLTTAAAAHCETEDHDGGDRCDADPDEGSTLTAQCCGATSVGARGCVGRVGYRWLRIRRDGQRLSP